MDESTSVEVPEIESVTDVCKYYCRAAWSARLAQAVSWKYHKSRDGQKGREGGCKAVARVLLGLISQTRKSVQA